jgi:hypothetical protein
MDWDKPVMEYWKRRHEILGIPFFVKVFSSTPILQYSNVE